MKSKLAEYAEQQLIEAAKRMTPEQRLRAFIEHSRQMSRLRQAGKEIEVAHQISDDLKKSNL